jgi:hypothetical protein
VSEYTQLGGVRNQKVDFGPFQKRWHRRDIPAAIETVSRPLKAEDRQFLARLLFILPSSGALRLLWYHILSQTERRMVKGSDRKKTTTGAINVMFFLD